MVNCRRKTSAADWHWRIPFEKPRIHGCSRGLIRPELRASKTGRGAFDKELILEPVRID